MVATNWNQAQPAPLAVWKMTEANFPNARYLGIYVRRNIAGTNTRSLHAEGRALDIGLKVSHSTEKMIGDGLFDIFARIGGRIGLQEAIWNQEIWRSGNPVVHRYTGQNPHTDHVHVGFTRNGSQQTNFPLLLLEIAILRTGLEDILRGRSNVA